MQRFYFVCRPFFQFPNSLVQMSDNSDSIHIYDHHKPIVRVIAHPDGLRCITVGCEGAKMFSLLSHEHFMTFEGLASLTLWNAALLNSVTLVGLMSRGEMVFWSLRNGSILLRCHVEEVRRLMYHFLTLLVPFSRNRIMVVGKEARLVGDRSKAVVLELKEDPHQGPAAESHVLNVLSIVSSFGGVVRDVSAHNDRFATAGPGKTVQVWEWDTDKFRCVKVLRMGRKIDSVSLSEKYVLCTDSSENEIQMFDSRTMKIARTIKIPFAISRSLPTNNDRHLIMFSSSYSRTVAVFDIDDEKAIWSAEFQGGIKQLDISYANGAQLIVATHKYGVWQCSLPADVVSKIGPLEAGLLDISDSTIASLPPLQAALSSCLAGLSSPFGYCNSLITYTACSVSFAEWCSAHHILMLTVQNGDVARSTEHEGNVAYWFKNLYLAIKDLEITSEEDLAAAELYLREAKKMGVIEGIEAVLTALHVTKDMHEQVRTLHRAGILIFEKVMRVEKSLNMLRDSCERYRKQQKYSQCISMALQIIPVVGGITAAVLTAGADLAEGLSVKDLADYAFGLGCKIAEGDISSLGHRIFGRAAIALSPSSVAQMNPSDFRRLEEAVSACGLSVKELRQLFIEHSHETQEAWVESASKSNPHVKEGSDEPATILPPPARKLLAAASTAVMDTNLSVIDAQNFVRRKPSELRNFAVERSVIERMNQNEIAELWAAFIVRYDDQSMESFVSFKDRIVQVLVANELDSSVIVDRDALSSHDLAKSVVDALNKDGMGGVSIGTAAKVKQFINAIIP